MTQRAYRLTVFSLFLAVSAFAGENSKPDPEASGQNSKLNCPCEGGREFTKNITREFDQLPNGTTALYNKYGKVDVKTWAQNKVKIDINIVVNADNQSDADRTFNRIKVDFYNSNGYVKAETQIEDGGNNGGWMGTLTSWGGSNSCNDFKINYDVYLPIGNSVDLKNRYGDSFLAALEGKLTAEIKYGDLRSEGLKNDLALDLGYGKANFVNAVNIGGSISYGEITVGECRDIRLDTKYSDMEFRRANDLNLTSKYDDFEIGTIHNLTANSKYGDLKVTSAHNVNLTSQYSDLTLGWLGAKGDFDMSYGSVKLDALDKAFSELQIDGSYTDFTIVAGKNVGYKLDATGNYTDIKYPNGLNVSKFDESGSRMSVSGTAGDGRGLIRVKLNYGEFSLR